MTEGIAQAAQLLSRSRLGDFLVLAIVPLLVALFLRPLLALVVSSPLDSRVDTLVCLAASMPGLVFWALAPSTIHRLSFSKDNWACFAHCWAITAIFVALLSRASWRLLRQNGKVAVLLRLTRQPSPRLAELAKELGVRVLELPTSEPLCFVAGALKPRIVVSTGAWSRCSREELRVALLHERAHCRDWATLRVTIATFLNECSPWPVKSAISVLRHRNELAADREAVRHAESRVLVSALLKLMGSAADLPAIANFADRGQLKNRVESLLNPAPKCDRPFAGICAGVLLGAMAGLAWTPLGVHAAIRALAFKGCM